MQFSFPKLAWSEKIFDMLLKAIKSSVEKHDFDSGWIKTPSNKVISYPLQRLPVEVFCYASDNSDGSGFSVDAYTSVTSSSITIAGAKKYCRVAVNL